MPRLPRAPMRFWGTCVLCMGWLMINAGCSHVRHSTSDDGEVQEGDASYYSARLEGRRTASGERYHGRLMTCAHRTFPMGTRLKVTNLENGRRVVVEVNDRGPFVRGRIIDLSYAAARELGFLAQGYARVRVERSD